LGDKIEGGQPQAQTQNVQRCSTQTFYENRATGYNVVYEFNGKQYQVQMPNDPGPYVNLQVSPVSGSSAAPGSYSMPAPPVQPAPVIRPISQAPVFTTPAFVQPGFAQPVVVESYTTYVQPAAVYVRPAPVFVAAPVYYGRPYGYYGHPYRPYGYGTSVSIGYRGHFH
jgi:hypothetical protein